MGEADFEAGSLGCLRGPVPPSVRTCRASPQSMTLTTPNRAVITFDGFRSQWITPRLCAYAITWQMRSNTWRKRGRSSVAPLRRASSASSVGPSIRSIAKNGRVSGSSPTAYTDTTPGCWSDAVMRASSANRSWYPGLPRWDARSALRATSRRMTSSRPA